MRTPLLLAALLLATSALVPIVRTLSVETPARWWDAALIVEAARVAEGLPLYEDPDGGHATTMYGPILPYIYGAMFELTGPSNIAPRVVTIVSVVMLLALLVGAARRVAYFPAWLAFVAVALLLAADARTEYRYAHVRPDMIALLAACLAVFALYRGHVRRHMGWYAAGIAGIIVSVLLKQQMAVFAFVPGIPILMDRGLPPVRRLVLAAAPPFAGFLLLLAIKFGAPAMYFYMVEIGGAYTIFPKLVLRSIIDFAISVPLFFALLLQGLLHPSPLTRRDSQPWLWTLSAIAVTVPTSALSYGKLGGAMNSWLPALLAVLFACTLFFRDVAEWLDDERLGMWRRFCVSMVLAVLMVLCFPGLKANFIPVPSDADYQAAVRAVRALPAGRVESPEDPTIALHGRGHIGRSLYLEYDARPAGGLWPTTMPAVLERELRSADYIVEAHDPVFDFFGPDDVARLGFAPVWQEGRYTIWRRR